jgi:hypothetical protein
LQARKLSLSLSSSKEALSKSSQASFIYAWSLQRTKLCWNKPKRPIRVLQQHFEDTSKVLFKASNHQISLHITRPNSRSCKAQILALIAQINQVTIHQIQGKNQRIVIFFLKNILHRDCTHSYI